MNYQVIIHDAEEGGYWAEVIGMPGCYSQGETLAETKANIQEAAMAWMESQVAMALRKACRDKSSGKTVSHRTMRSASRFPFRIMVTNLLSRGF